MNIKQTVLVTGATGFVGMRLTKQLLGDGWRVIAVGRAQEKLAILKELGAHVITCELSDKQQVMSLPKADIVFHVAALSSPWGSKSAFKRANILATENLIAYAKKEQIKRMIYVSSASVYFQYQDQLSISEQAPLPKQFVNHYAWSKRQAEKAILAQQDFEGIILRPRGIIGAGDPAIVPRILKLLHKKALPLFRNGQALIDLTHIDNVVHACCLAINHGHSGEIYNITNGEPQTVQSLLTALAQAHKLPLKTRRLSYQPVYYLAGLCERLYHLLGKEPPVTRYTAGLLAYSQTLDITKAKDALSYQPIHSIEAGINSYGTA